MTRRVFLHGFLGAPEAWDEVAALLGDARALRPTLPGHGPAPWTPPGSFNDVVDAFIARELPPEPVTLVGYSLGARVALSVALRHPARVARAVLVGVAVGIDDPAARRARALSDDALAASLERDGVERFVDAWERVPLFDTQRSLPDGRLAAQRAWRTAHTARGLAWSLRALGLAEQPPSADAFARCAVPVDLVTGSRDDKFTAIARALARSRRGVTHTVAEGAGHNVVLEAPELVARVVARASP